MSLKNVRALAKTLDFLQQKYHTVLKLPWTNALNQFEITCLRSQAMHEEVPHCGDRKEIAVFSGDPLERIKALGSQASSVNDQLRDKLESLPRDQWPAGWSINADGEVVMPASTSVAEDLIRKFTDPDA